MTAEDTLTEVSRKINSMSSEEMHNRIIKQMEISDGFRKPDPKPELKIITGDIFEKKVDAIVNPVNCVGVMGKGLAKTFKKKYPTMYTRYRRDCERDNINVGEVKFYNIKRSKDSKVKYVITFPTKYHWRDESDLYIIRAGLKDLVRQAKKYKIRSISLPALGCGLGQLDWKKVRPILKKRLRPLVDEYSISVYIYAPMGDR